jgi:hypothetical protein
MTWAFVIGCVAGGTAVVLAWMAARLWKYCVSFSRVVVNVEPRRRAVDEAEEHTVTEAATTKH